MPRLSLTGGGRANQWPMAVTRGAPGGDDGDGGDHDGDDDDDDGDDIVNDDHDDNYDCNETAGGREHLSHYCRSCVASTIK